MENPCLTFVTPTLLAGDRSLDRVVCHEVRLAPIHLCRKFPEPTKSSRRSSPVVDELEPPSQTTATNCHDVVGNADCALVDWQPGVLRLLGALLA